MIKGDKLFFVTRDDIEKEAYFLEEVGNLYKVKLRENNNIVMIQPEQAFQIYPDYWESLEENEKNCTNWRDDFRQYIR